MSRIIGNNLGRLERDKIFRISLSAIKTCIWKEELDDEAKDCVAFIILSLTRVNSRINTSIRSWEKRNYWQKADNYRLKWGWICITTENLRTHLNNENFQEIINELVVLRRKIGEQTNLLPMKKSINRPIWSGSYKIYKSGSE